MSAQFRNHHGQRGMTLLELMISITLGMIVTAAVLAAYLSTRQTERAMAGQISLVQSGRTALAALSRDIRMAGSFGCLNHADGKVAYYFATATRSDLQLLPGGLAAERIASGTSNSASPWLLNSPARIDNATLLKLQFGAGSAQASATLSAGTVSKLSYSYPEQRGLDDSRPYLALSSCGRVDLYAPGSNGVALKRTVDTRGGELSVTLAPASSSVGSAHVDGSFDLHEYVARAYFVGADHRLYQSDLDANGKRVVREVAENVKDLQLNFGVQECNTASGLQSVSFKGVTQMGADDWAKLGQVRISLQLEEQDGANGVAIRSVAGSQRRSQTMNAVVALRGSLCEKRG